jgi:hypothetical protein
MVSRAQESQAVTQSRAIKQTDIRTMTDLTSVETVKLFSIMAPKFEPFILKRVNI